MKIKTILTRKKDTVKKWWSRLVNVERLWFVWTHLHDWTSSAALTRKVQPGWSGFPYQGSSWQTQRREQAACASCVRQCWHWHQPCPQGRYRCWSPSVLPFSSASWWLRHWRSKVLAASPVGPRPEAACSWTTQLLSCTAAGEWWYGPVRRTLLSVILLQVQ